MQFCFFAHLSGNFNFLCLGLGYVIVGGFTVELLSLSLSLSLSIMDTIGTAQKSPDLRGILILEVVL